MSSHQVFPLLSLPNELIIAVAQQLTEITDLHSFLLTNRRLSTLLPTTLYMHAANSTLSLVALYWAISTDNKPMTALLLQKSTQVLSTRTSSHTFLHRTPHPCPAKTLSLILAHGGGDTSRGGSNGSHASALRLQALAAQPALLQIGGNGPRGLDTTTRFGHIATMTCRHGSVSSCSARRCTLQRRACAWRLAVVDPG